MANKYLIYILFGLLGLFFTGCSDIDTPILTSNPGTGVRIEGDKVIITTSCDVDGFKEATSRSLEEGADLSSLHLYLIEFIDNGSPLTNTLSNVYRPSKEEPNEENTVVTYEVTLNKTNQPRILHLLAVADDNLDIPYGVEASVMPALTTQDGTDAYWRRLAFPSGYCVKQTGDGNQEIWVANEDLNNKLINKNVKLVRNFAKITVGVKDDISNFKLEGFMVVNIPTKGTMVPYSASKRLFPEFLDDDGNPLSYQTVAETYNGISPANTPLGNPEVTESTLIPEGTLTNITTIEDGQKKSWGCLPPVYMYERPFNSINRTYIIVKGKYHPNIGESKTTYYKLDLGNNVENNIFKYYGLLRNFNYFIRIIEVNSNGYDTPAAAAVGTVYNNISFDVDTDHLVNMSDGQDVIRVNFTTAVITDPDEVLEFQYRYKYNIWVNNGKYNNSLVTPIDLKTGNVIKEISEWTDKESNWRSVTLRCYNPTSVTETQSFILVNPETGLGRTINLVSHLKWDFENVKEFARIWENYPETYKGLNTENSISYANETYADKCGTATGSQFTIFFDIPDNIPEVLFPLVFTIESKLQGLENEPMGTIVVSSGPSLFEDQEVEGNRIQYNKSVTWTEYNSPLRMDTRDDNGTLIENKDGGPNVHRVRCRFRTIEEVTDGTEVAVRIANENFIMTEVKFKRVTEANSLNGPGLVINN